MSVAISNAPPPPPPPTVQFNSTNYSVAENAGSVTLTVSLSATASVAVTVKYATKDGPGPDGAVADWDYTATSGTLTFSVGDTNKVISIPIIDDSIPEPTRAFSLELSEPTGATLGPQISATVTIIDDDPPPPTVAFSPSPVVQAAGNTSSLTAVVTPAQSATQVTYTSSDTSIASVVGAGPDLTVIGIKGGITTINASVSGQIIQSVAVYVTSLDTMNTDLWASPDNVIAGESAPVVFRLTSQTQPIAGREVKWVVSAVWDESANPVTDSGLYSNYGTLTVGGITDADGRSTGFFQGGPSSGTIEISAAENSSEYGQNTEKKQKIANKAGKKINLNIDKVKGGEKQVPGGFVMINANNENDSGYTDDWNKIPKTADKDKHGAIAKEKDLVKITLAVKVAAGGTEKVVLSSAANGRAKIKVWEKATHENEVTLPKEWNPANLPKELYLEGVLEGAAEREIKLTLELRDGVNTLETDFVNLSVVPILTKLEIIASEGLAPSLEKQEGGN